MNWQLLPWRRREEEAVPQPRPVGYFFDGGRWRHYESELSEATRQATLERRAAEADAERHRPATDGFRHGLPDYGKGHV